VGFLPLLATVATLAPVAGAARLGIGIVVLGAAVCLAGRNPDGRRRRGGPGEVLVRLVVTTLGIGILAYAYSRSLVAGDAVFVATLLLARLAGRFGPRWAAAGRVLLLPLTALFIAPPVAAGSTAVAHLAWASLACLVASGWTVLFGGWLPEPRPTAGQVGKLARQAATSPAGSRRTHAFAAAVLSLDRRLAGAPGARTALFTLEYTVDRVHSGTAAPADVTYAAAELRDALSRLSATPEAVEETDDPRDAPSAATRSRLALQSAAAVLLAFIVGQNLFPDHWPWTVITVITVGFGARSRGEVVVKSAQRLAGAALATTVATPLAGALGEHRAVTVVVILAVLAAGMYLREYSYLWWAVAMTTALAFLYGLLRPGGGLDLLGQRLLAIAVGAACAVLPAIWLAPRSRDLVRKRTATALRRLSASLDDPDLASVRRWDAAVAELRTAAKPLHAVRQLRRTPETGWPQTLATCGATLRAHLAEPAPAHRGALRRTLAVVTQEVRATARRPAAGPTAGSTGRPI
jgi:hypothetical protein